MLISLLFMGCSESSLIQFAVPCSHLDRHNQEDKSAVTVTPSYDICWLYLSISHAFSQILKKCRDFVVHILFILNIIH